MKRTTLAAIAGAVLLFAAGFTAWSYKSIHLEVDGQASTIQGFAWTVNDALRITGISLTSADRAKPAATQWLGWASTVQVERAAQIIIAADGQEIVLFSAERMPAQLLATASIELQPGDKILVDGKPIALDQALPPYGENRLGPLLEVRRAKSFQLIEGEDAQKFLSTASSIGAALWQEGWMLHTTDLITPTMDSAIHEGLAVSLRRARPIVILASGITLTLSTAADQVGIALAQAGLSPQGLDYSIPLETEAIPADGKIRLVRVSEEVIIEQTPLPFETSYQAAAEVEIDNQVVLQAGEYGATARRVRVRYEDGVEISRDVETEWIAKTPQDHIIGYGTKIVQHTLDTPDGPMIYWRALRMYAVSYHPGETGGDTTASGLKVRKGLAAVDTRYIPFFTEMYVPGYGPAMAADTGGGVVGRIIDLAYPTDEYVAWHEYVTVYFLWPPPANIVWIIP